jgi:hypothetical protein
MKRNILWIATTVIAVALAFSVSTSSNHGLPTHKMIRSPATSSTPSTGHR